MLKLFKIEIVGFCMENGLSKIGVCQFTPCVTLVFVIAPVFLFYLWEQKINMKSCLRIDLLMKLA